MEKIQAIKQFQINSNHFRRLSIYWVKFMQICVKRSKINTPPDFSRVLVILRIFLITVQKILKYQT